MPTVLRILDANANRAREALRVMEEAARFILNDQALTTELKTIRHDLCDAIRAVPGLEANRDTQGDVGVSIQTEQEKTRGCVADVVVAAGKRLSEALRAMEEYGKTIQPVNGENLPFASTIESLRYRGYNAEKNLSEAMTNARAKQWRLCVLISAHLCTYHDWFDVARIAWEAGADCVQLREKDLEDKRLIRRARKLVETPDRGTLIINDRPDIAMIVGADGVHLGQNDMTAADVRRLFGNQLLVGVSTARIEEAEQAARDGADYCGVGPMFTTTTKHKDLIVGPKYMQEYLQWNRLPHLAIGGITVDNVDEMIDVGARGLAVCATVCDARDPGKMVCELLDAIGQSEQQPVK